MSAGGRTCGAEECIFLLTRLWLTGKILKPGLTWSVWWNEDWKAQFSSLRSLSVPQASVTTCFPVSVNWASPWFPEPRGASCLAPLLLCTKKSESRQAEEFSFRVLKCFCWVLEAFFQMLVHCQVSCCYPQCLLGVALSLLIPWILEVMESLWKKRLLDFFKIEGMSTVKVLDTFSKQLNKYTRKKNLWSY